VVEATIKPPEFGSAGNRTVEQSRAAKRWALAVITVVEAQLGVDGLMYFTDGSAFPPEEGGGTAGAFALYHTNKLDEVVHSEVHDAGRVGTNIFAELHGI
jgi:hypothetical protein